MFFQKKTLILHREKDKRYIEEGVFNATHKDINYRSLGEFFQKNIQAKGFLDIAEFDKVVMQNKNVKKTGSTENAQKCTLIKSILTGYVLW